MRAREVPAGQSCLICFAREGKDHKMSCDPPWRYQESGYTSKIPKYGDKMTVKEFLDACDVGAFVDYDGSGHPARDNKMMRSVNICPSNRKMIPADATHIIWFNR